MFAKMIEFYQFLAKPRKLCKDYGVASMYVADLPSFDNISNYDMNVIWISNINNI